MFNNVKMQVKSIISRKIAVIMVFVLTGMVLANYFSNLKTYDGLPVDTLVDPMRILMLSSEGNDTLNIKFVFMQLFPIIAILPAALSYADDRAKRTDVFLVTRMGKNGYFMSKMIAVFLVTFLVFLIPFLIEIILYKIAFPSGAEGNLYSGGIYSQQYIDNMEKVMFLGTFKISSVIYAIFSVCLYSFVSGVLALFVLAVSMYMNRFKVLLLFPSYILMYGIGALYSIIPGANVHTSHFEYFSLFDSSSKNQTWFLLIVLIVLVMSVTVIIRQMRRDRY